MSRFSALKEATVAKAVPLPQNPAGAASGSGAAKAREGKKLVGGWFSPELNHALKQLALDEKTTVQALVGEGVDLLMRSRSKHPFGEK
ncbi:MAG: ribbon-helix-helix domain-containing protein [Caulobacteraceae bacterium]